MDLQELNSKVKYKYSKSSLEKISTLEEDLQKLLFLLADYVDIKIVFAHRTPEEQKALYDKGRSSFDGYNKKSKHNYYPSKAVDILPLPKGINMYTDDGENTIRWAQWDGFVQGIAKANNINIRSGFKWRGDFMEDLARPYSENTLPDGNHIELL